MYCNKCGLKVVPGQNKCMECGASVSEIEYNGGFWDLVGENASKAPVFEQPVAEEPVMPAQPEPVVEQPVAEKKIRKSHVFSAFLFVTTMIFLVAALALGTWAFILNGKYNREFERNENLEIQLEKVKTEYSSLEDEKAVLEKHIQELDQQIENLQNAGSSDSEVDEVDEVDVIDVDEPVTVGGATESEDSNEDGGYEE